MQKINFNKNKELKYYYEVLIFHVNQNYRIISRMLDLFVLFNLRNQMKILPMQTIMLIFLKDILKYK